MRKQAYMFDSPKLITEVLESIPNDEIRKLNVEIIEVSRPDCGDLENTSRRNESMFRMMMEEMRSQSHNPKFDNDAEMEYRQKRRSNCYVLIVKGIKDFDFKVLDDLVWMNGGITAKKPSKFFYKKADKIVTLIPNYSSIENAFGNKENYSDIYDGKFGR